MLGQRLGPSGLVISHLNISSVQTRYSVQYSTVQNSTVHTHGRDGGEYSCTATNTVATATHTDTIRVYGPPVSRGQVGT